MMDKIRFLAFFSVALVFVIVLAGCTEQNGGKADVFFCPADYCEQRAVSAIASSKDSVDIAMYSFTSRGLFRELLNAEEHGVKVRVVADYEQSSIPSSVVKWLDGNGIETRIYNKGITLHDKFAIVDGALVMTGSYNWTKNADTSNRENLVFISDRAIAKQYEDEFFRLWVQAG